MPVAAGQQIARPLLDLLVRVVQGAAHQRQGRGAQRGQLARRLLTHLERIVAELLDQRQDAILLRGGDGVLAEELQQLGSFHADLGGLEQFLVFRVDRRGRRGGGRRGWNRRCGPKGGQESQRQTNGREPKRGARHDGVSVSIRPQPEGKGKLRPGREEKAARPPQSISSGWTNSPGVSNGKGVAWTRPSPLTPAGENPRPYITG